MESMVSVPPGPYSLLLPSRQWQDLQRDHAWALEDDPPRVGLVLGEARPAVVHMADTPCDGPNSSPGGSPWAWGPPQGQGHQVQEFRAS